jgi:hypothetical protein
MCAPLKVTIMPDALALKERASDSEDYLRLNIAAIDVASMVIP